MKLTGNPGDAHGLRDKHKSRTRENILQAVASRLESSGLAQLSFAEIAREADIGESTIYRYFANKEALLEAFWAWAPTAIKRDRFPESFAELAGRLVDDFKSFDSREPLIRGMLASPVGRTSRINASAERQGAFRALVTHEVGELPEAELLRLAAVIQQLYSATTWANFKDYWDMDGEAAARAAIASIGALLEEARRKSSPRGT
ncbi:TetR/AcrR family transcriptional regulator [Herbaspirillum sp. WKF16]|uniref:TetR/AcrR family transcriptional regulator n=1 Tax=Herbaspirillum sp. WKF16 TaxID=3028312 RepID=UPI0023A933FA|nr:TetR/AcrR family transcriptional regulator [Herbaspirillum sp. WKF16]WDZ98345.1 TetR/AcrR family transcriptional regulator [Herbaspirillum sp. WKF16]